MKNTNSHQLKKISRYIGLKQKLDCDLLNNNWHEINTKNVSRRIININFFDLFSGAGGISLGLTQAGFKKRLSIEVDKDASETIKKNFPNSIHFEDKIENLTNKKILTALGGKKIHLVCGGPPCNGFSVAGYRDPSDPRNFLFREFVRVVKLLKPDFFVMENVPGILTMSKGQVREIIISAFQNLGYDNTSVRILEAANFEVPQMRTRAIIIGNKHGLKNPYPKIINDKDNFLPIEDCIMDLMNHPRDASINHEWTEHSKQYEKRISKVKSGESLYDTFRDAFKRQYLKVPSMAIKENHGGTHIHPILNRVISAREMARIQTFPDSFIFSGRMKRVMWQVGNAVPVKLAYYIGLAIKDSFIRNKIL